MAVWASLEEQYSLLSHLPSWFKFYFIKIIVKNLGTSCLIFHISAISRIYFKVNQSITNLSIFVHCS